MSLAARLKHETRDAHERIEAAFDLDARLASRTTYRDLLVRMLAFHEMFEAAVAPHLAGTGFARLGRADALRHDLVALGSDTGDRVGIADRTERLDVADRAEALGALYVVEGSVLGGVLIARDAERCLGIGPETGGGFFAGAGRDTARLWRDFASRLDALADPAGDDRSVAAARRTFAVMRAHLCGPVASGEASRSVAA